MARSDGLLGRVRFLVEAMDAADAMKSLEGLIKWNRGHWKSPAQARFLQGALEQTRDSEALAWARSRGHGGVVVLLMSKLQGYGHRDPSKVRYVSRVYVLDDGGVVVSARVPVVHPKGGGWDVAFDWRGVQVEFERSEEPAIRVDVGAERAAKVVANQPAIQQIKVIPGWETQDILVSFIAQLEDGHALSPKQLAIVYKLLPSKERAAVVGDRDDVRKAAKRVWAWVADEWLPVYLEDMVRHIRENPVDPFGEAIDVEAAIKREAEQVEQFARQYRQHGYTGGWMDGFIYGRLMGLVKMNLRAGIGGDGAGSIVRQLDKALAARVPSLTGQHVMQFFVSAAEKIKDLGGPAAVKKVPPGKSDYPDPGRALKGLRW